MTALAGCIANSDDSPDDDDETNDDRSADAKASVDGSSDAAGDGTYGAWRMERYDAANRLSVPHDGVDGEPEIRWTADLEGTVRPPVVYDDVAYVNHGSGTYTAIDLDDGETVWRYDAAGFAAPAVSADAVYVVGDGVEALDHETTDVLWASGHEPTEVEALRVYDGTVYAGIGDRVIAFDDEGEDVLEIETAATVQSLAIDDERVYVRSRPDPDEDDFVMAAFDRSSADRRWQHEIHQAEQWTDDRYSGTFPLVDGTVYTIDENVLIAIDGANGDREDVVQFDGSALSRPTVYGDRAYVRTSGVTAYDLESGDELDAWDPGEYTSGAVVIGGESVYTVRGTGSTSPQNVLAMDVDSGDIDWERAAPELASNHVPVVLNGLILLAIDDPGLVAFG